MGKKTTLAIRLEEKDLIQVKNLASKFDVSISEFVRTGMQMILRDVRQYKSNGIEDKISNHLNEGMNLYTAIISGKEEREPLKKYVV